ACILNDRGNVDALVCPYHGWTYGLDGRLLKAPRIGAIKDFDRDAFGLRPIPVDTWAEMIVLHLGGQADQTPLHAELQPLQKRLEGFGIEGLTFHTRRRYTLACNWKVFVDNYLDGGYHVHTIHPGLAQELDTASYRTESWPTFSIQSSASSTQGHGDRMGSGALYAYVYPNLMINRYGPVMDINMVWPTGPEQCDVVFEYLFDEQAIGQEALDAFVAQCLDQSDLIQQEDVAICESVQRGLRSSAYTTGRYAPKLEHAMHRFHTQLASDLT
ncbi:MAG: SRPBCC family protein, partial [Myxococcota bacterium]